jgi:predicted GNAT family acetyltransferase
MTTKVTHNPAESRYDLFLDEVQVGLADYELREGNAYFVHTEVTPALRGQNLAAVLMREAFAGVRAGDLGDVKVIPVCSYVVRYMQLHPETHDLLGIPIEEAAAACRLPRIRLS